MVDWKEAIPTPIPDDQNLALARVMTGCIRGREDKKIGDWQDEPVFDKTAEAAGQQAQEIFAPDEPSNLNNSFSFPLTDTDTLDILGNKDQDRLEELAQIVEPYRPILAELREECTQRSGSYLPGDYSSITTAPFSSFQLLRSATKLLTAEAILALHNGNSELAFDNCLAMHRISDLNPQTPFLINVLVQTDSVRSFMSEILWHGISHDAFNEDQLKKIIELCAGIDLIKKLGQSCDYEHLAMADATLQFVAAPADNMHVFGSEDEIPLFLRSDSITVGKLTTKALWHFIPATGWNLQMLSRYAKFTSEYHTAFDSKNGRIDKEKLKDRADQLERLKEQDAFFDGLLIFTLPYQSFADQPVDAQRRIDLLHIAAALSLGTKQGQALPEGLSSFKGTLPTDPTNGLPYAYQRDPEGFTISSASEGVDLSVNWKPQPNN
jgi:hypothetical protein